MASIQYDRMIMEKKKQKEISDVENQAHEARIKSQADADFYLIQKQSESNRVCNSELAEPCSAVCIVKETITCFRVCKSVKGITTPFPGTKK